MVKFDSNGLVPAIVQDAATGEVLMMAYMNAESLQQTLASKEAWFWSRSRQELWHKGATSGNTMKVQEVLVDGRSEDPAFPWEGRTAAQAPEIDGVVYLRNRDLRPGQRLPVEIVEVDGYDLVGAAV